MSVHVIIGKNFGDEGKGLATDYFAARSQNAGHRCLVIRHNGGGQAGHTVDLPEKRFVFHQLSSGSFRNADTYWSHTFLPDLFKLTEEAEAFYDIHGRLPIIFGHPMCRCVYIDDVLINMALEAARGSDRHGSCGMGINEAVERSRNPEFCLWLGHLREMTEQELYIRLLQVRRNYLPLRLEQLGLSLESTGEYADLLTDPVVLQNAAAQMHMALRLVTVAEENIVQDYDDLIFEGAQGLLLDEDYLDFAPHLTSSKTGCQNPMDFLRKHLPQSLPELVYVTRTYVTRHGAGPLPCEPLWHVEADITDETNQPNPWQGALRFAPHGTKETFFGPMLSDCGPFFDSCRVSCMVTHANTFNGRIYTAAGYPSIEQWFHEAPTHIEKLYISPTPYARDISTLAAMPDGRIFRGLRMD